MEYCDATNINIKEDANSNIDLSGTTKTSHVSFWESLGNPRFILAPMVDQSELAFRLLTKKYGAQLTYTPMLHSRLYVEEPNYRIRNFQTCPEDTNVIAQFCGDNPKTLGEAARLISPHVNAVDINLGCPQGIAKRGHYGAFLLQEPDLVEEIVRSTIAESQVPVTCKIRKVNKHDLQPTINLAKRLEAAGCSALCVHGRSIEEKGQMAGKADWEAITRVKKVLNIPVIANGGISSYTDAIGCLAATGADAVMSAEAILEYPALFHDTPIDPDILVAEYLELAEKYSTSGAIIKAHLFHSLYSGLQIHTDLRAELGKAKSLEEFNRIAKTLRQRRLNVSHKDKLGWYSRYWKPLGQSNSLVKLLETDSNLEPNLNDSETTYRLSNNPLLHNELEPTVAAKRVRI